MDRRLDIRIVKVKSGYIVQNGNDNPYGQLNEINTLVATDATSLAALVKKLAQDSDKLEVGK